MASVGLMRSLLRRVEVGAMLGAVVIWLFFALVASRNWLTINGVARILDEASTLGIMAVAVALLMIGGEFDLSTGVMTGTTGLIAGMIATKAGLNLWVGIFVAFLFAAAVGFINGFMVVKTRLPSFM
jgi:simple sugar transport system permease protein